MNISCALFLKVEIHYALRLYFLIGLFQSITLCQ